MTIPKSITPSKLRMLLMAALGLILLSGGAVFYFAYNQLGQIAAETGNQVATAKQSQDSLQKLQTLQKELAAERDTVLMASNVVANSQNYAYQDLLINDLTIYAQRAGLSVTNISFMSQAGGSTEAGAGASTGTSTDSAAGGAAGGAPALSGLKKATVDITLSSPTDYRGLLNFLHYVEQNLTKLKVSKVTMTKASEDITVDTLNLEVYVK